MSGLDHSEIVKLHEAIVRADLADRRRALLEGLDPALVAGLKSGSSPGEQILRDLYALATMRLEDGTDPFIIWLRNAAALARPRATAAVFLEALARRGQAVPANEESGDGSRSEEAQAVPTNLPPRRHVIGRERELTALAERLAWKEPADPACLSLHGLSGVGKTSLALEYAHRAVQSTAYPGGIFWLDAEGEPSSAFARFAEILRFHGPRGVATRIPPEVRDVKALVELTRLALANQPSPSLLILDDVTHPGWRALLPGGKVRALVITREPRLAIGETFHVTPLEPEDARSLALDLSRSGAAGAEEAALGRVVESTLGRLPVAVEVASHVVRDLGLSWVEYENHLRRETEAALDGATGNIAYGRGVFAALDLSIARCAAGSPERRLLDAAALFAPSAIPLDWIQDVADVGTDSFESIRALATLRGLGLVALGQDDGTLSVQDLVHLRLRAHAREPHVEARRRAARCVARWLRTVVDPSRMPAVDARRLHIDQALIAAEQAGAADEWIEIADRMATHLQNRGLHEDSCALFARVVAATEALQPPDPDRVARSCSNLAMSLRELGRTDEALLHLRRALAMATELHGPEHPKVAVLLSNLAVTLHGTGGAEEAASLLRRALHISESAYGENHPKVAVALSNLALVVNDMGGSRPRAASPGAGGPDRGARARRGPSRSGDGPVQLGARARRAG